MFGQKLRMGLTTNAPRELSENIMTGMLEESDELSLSSTPAPISSENQNTEDVEVLDNGE